MTDPIFILGMTARTGTTFTFRLLALHPDVEAASRLHEDYVVQHAHLLVEYARRTRQRWNPGWPIRPGAEARLIGRLGRGLYAFLTEEALDRTTPGSRRPLFKTPSVQSVQHFFDLFPDASLLILVRDGRDVVESGVRSFGWTYEVATRWWCRAARTVLDFEARYRGKARYRVVRYEDLVADPEGTLRSLLAFLRLDPVRYDFQAARDLPVYGSSSFRGERAEVHWQPVPKTEAFRPVGRWEGWSPYRRRRFVWAAGDLMRALGYEIEGRLAGWERAQNRLVDRGAWLMAVGRRASGIVSRLLRPRASDLSRPGYSGTAERLPRE